MTNYHTPKFWNPRKEPKAHLLFLLHWEIPDLWMTGLEPRPPPLAVHLASRWLTLAIFNRNVCVFVGSLSVNVICGLTITQPAHDRPSTLKRGWHNVSWCFNTETTHNMDVQRIPHVMSSPLEMTVLYMTLSAFYHIVLINILVCCKNNVSLPTLIHSTVNQPSTMMCRDIATEEWKTLFYWQALDGYKSL